jgi:hypothetical protein
LRIFASAKAILLQKGENKNVQTRHRHGDMAFDTGMPILADHELRREGNADHWRSMRQLSKA